MSSDLSTFPVTRRRTGTGTLSLGRQSLAGLRVLLVLTVVLGVVYPLAVTAVGQVAFRWQSNGSLLAADGTHVTSASDDRAPAIGSALVGQAFDGDQWFHPRPSAAGDGWDTLSSAGSNLGPESPDLLTAVEERRREVAAAERIAGSEVPADALTASASGLDPDISVQYARLQVARVAEARRIDADDVAGLVESSVQGRPLGILGEPRVNVLRLNLALQTMGS